MTKQVQKTIYDAPTAEVLEVKLEASVLTVSGRDNYDNDDSNPFA